MRVDVLALILAALAVAFSVIALRRTARRARPIAPAVPVDQVASGPQSAGLSESLVAAVATSLRHVAVVRFDAFDDVSGRQSFTAAILDDNGDGLVITSLHARTESRTLLKGITDGRGESLSPEEQQAVDRARGER